MRFSVEQIISLIGRSKIITLPNRHRVKVSKALKTFAVWGTECADCHIKGKFFQESVVDGKKSTLTLFAVTDKLVKMNADHIIPLSRGGANHIYNFQTMCEKCNTKKDSEIVGGKADHLFLLMHLKEEVEASNRGSVHFAEFSEYYKKFRRERAWKGLRPDCLPYDEMMNLVMFLRSKYNFQIRFHRIKKIPDRKKRLCFPSERREKIDV